MNRHFFILICALLLSTTVFSADLPTVTIDHLYYLRGRGEHVRRLSADDMIDYVVSQKLAGRAFDDLYSQLSSMRIDLAKLQRIENLPDEDKRVQTLKRTYNVEYNLLIEEAQRIQRGIVREGVIAGETLESIARVQQGR